MELLELRPLRPLAPGPIPHRPRFAVSLRVTAPRRWRRGLLAALPVVARAATRATRTPVAKGEVRPAQRVPETIQAPPYVAEPEKADGENGMGWGIFMGMIGWLGKNLPKDFFGLVINSD